MKVLTPDGQVIESTEKAYNVLYAPLGYKPYVEQQKEPDKEPEVPEKQEEKPVNKRKAGGKK